MARRKLEERNTRKLSKKSNGSYSVTLPVEAVRDLEWKKGQKLVVRKSGSKIIIEDWEK
jgi:bifunctional DNA-binding transcriptional regulator/antitoxin component of YhaV-PrlF toxin-antitoxin module